MKNNKKARIIAFYLPQYHSIPENDKWWGKGFTEWTNVGKAKPLFPGHYQPRVPADLGYYDLRMPEIREAQAKMAKEAGIEGFCYWHYWFGNGKQLLERPFKEVLESGKPDYPFCLSWANHSWTNHSWDSSSQWKKKSILIAQTYPGEKDIIEHFYHILPAFFDKRYIKVNNEPLFHIFDPFSLPDAKRFLDIWSELAIQSGLPGIHFVGSASGWESQCKKIKDMGFDAINRNGQWNAEITIKGKINRMFINLIIEKFGGIIMTKFKYRDIINHLFCDLDKLDTIYPTVIPQWDHSPRSGRRSVIYTGSTPNLFKKHLREAISLVGHKPDEKKIIFLKSWNEWAEGNYVEPDIVYGHGFLNAFKDELFVI
jgi:hypothetical protein